MQTAPPLSYAIEWIGVEATQISWVLGQFLAFYGPRADFAKAPAVQIVGRAKNAAAPRRRDGSFPARFAPGDGWDRIRIGGVTLRVSRDGSGCVILPRVRPAGLAASLIETALLRCVAMSGGVSVHGTAFCLGEARVLALAPSGGGKSTLASLALAAGGMVVSDDALLAGVHDGEPVVTAWRRSLFLRQGTIPLLPGRLRRIARRKRFVDGVRWVLDRTSLGEQTIDAVAPNRLWLVSVDRRRRESLVTPLPQAHVVAALMKATSLLNFSCRYPEQRRLLFDVVIRLASSGPAFRVALGHDLLETPAAALERLVMLTT